MADAAEKARLAGALCDAVADLGYPREFGEVLAEQLGGAWSMRRMLGYLRGANPRSMEEIADELVAILDDRSRIVEKMRADESNAAVTRFYNRPREDNGLA